jgi:methionyl aminopeptidase
MTILKNKYEYQSLRSSGKLLAEALILAEKMIEPGVSTAYIDRKLEEFIRDNNAEPAFKGYRGFPATICASLNDVIVHGIPSEKTVLREGDILGIDVGVKMKGFYTDAARTFPVGRVSDKALRLIAVTREGLKAGVELAVAGNRISDISAAIQKVAQNFGYQEVRAFVGHGTGRHLHEPPEVPNWTSKGKGRVLEEGLVLAVEPMFNEGTREVEVMADGWTAVTADRKLSAHFENTIVVGKAKVEVVT